MNLMWVPFIVLAAATPIPQTWEMPLPAAQPRIKSMHIEPYHYRCIQKSHNNAIIVLEPIEEGARTIGPIWCTNCVCGPEK